MDGEYEKSAASEKYSKEREEELFDYEGENTNLLDPNTPKSESEYQRGSEDIPIQYPSKFPEKGLKSSSSRIFWKMPDRSRSGNAPANSANVESFYDDVRRSALSADDYRNEMKSVVSDADAATPRTYFGISNPPQARRESIYSQLMEKPPNESIGENASYQNMSVVDTLEMHGILKKKGGYLIPNDEGPKSVIEAALLPHVTFEQLEVMNEAVQQDSVVKETPEGYDQLIASELKNEGIPLPALIPKYPLDKTVPFLVLLACKFHSYGAPANRTEWNMNAVSRAFGIDASYSVMPTLITVTFGRVEGMDAISRTIRITQDYSQCGKLYKLEKMISKIVKGGMSLYEAREVLDKIIEESHTYPRYMRIVAQMLCSTSTCALFFDGSPYDVILATFMGLVTALFSWFSEYNMAFGRISSLMSAMVAAIFAVIFAFYVDKMCFLSVVMGAVVWNMPGLSLLLSVRELSTDNMISGTVRMFASFISALKIGFGITIGAKCAFWISKETVSKSCTQSIYLWARLPFLVVLIVSFDILLDFKVKQWIGQFLVSFVAYSLNLSFGTFLALPTELTAVISAFGVALVGNILSKYTKIPGILFIHTAILLLVPGGLAIKSGTYFFDDTWSGLKFSYDMIIIGFSLTVGTLIADFAILRDKSLIYHLF